MKKMKQIVLAIAVVLLVGVIGSKPLTVHAANPTTVSLKTGKTYTAYDITGDKKKDKILLKETKNQQYGYSDGLKVYINGAIKYQFNNKYYESINVKLYTLKNGTPFLYIYCVENNYDGPVCALFQYKSGKLSKVIDFQTLFSKYGSHPYGEILKVNGNSLKAQFYVMSWSLGASYYRYNYTYKNGTLKRTSTVGTIYKAYSDWKESKKFVAGKKLQTYKSVNAKKKAFSVAKGKQVTVDKVYVGNYGMWIRLKYNGKYGWLKSSTTYRNGPPFSDVHYAG